MNAELSCYRVRRRDTEAATPDKFKRGGNAVYV